MSRTIVITSGKGGVGKTTLTANIGKELAKLKQNVVLIDVDLGLNNLDVLMDIENKIVYDLIDVIENRCRLKQALIEDRYIPNLYILPAAHSYDKSKINAQNIKLVTMQLGECFDYVLLDCPAGIEVGFHRAVGAADEALVVVTPHISSIRDADKTIQLLKNYKLNNIQVIVNRARGDLILNKEMLTCEDISEMLHVPIVGVVPDDDAINLLSNLGLQIKNNKDGMSALEILGRNIHNGTSIIYDVTEKYKGFFGALKRKFKRM